MARPRARQPSPVAAEKRGDDFDHRTCETKPYWADAFLAELRPSAAAVTHSVVIAGDLNKARAYDAGINHRCGGEFLDTMDQLGFVDATVRAWGGERPTRLLRPYHLDRVFTSAPSGVGGHGGRRRSRAG